MAHTAVLENGFPLGTTSLSNQVAGHLFNDSKPRIGLLIDENGYVLKPIEGPVRGKREVDFYQELTTSTDEISDELKSYVPEFYGTRKLPWKEEEVDYIVLSNATGGMLNPCIMDVKIGKISWDPEAPPSKKEKEVKKYAECKKEYGFCIPGFHFYDARTGKLTRHGKEFGKTLGKETTKDAFKLFLNLHQPQGRQVLEVMLERLRRILSWCEKQRTYLFYSSSLLLAYDASQFNDKGLEVPFTTVTMIDFAHVFPSNGECDTNYIDGVSSLVKLFESLLLET